LLECALKGVTAGALWCLTLKLGGSPTMFLFNLGCSCKVMSLLGLSLISQLLAGCASKYEVNLDNIRNNREELVLCEPHPLMLDFPDDTFWTFFVTAEKLKIVIRVLFLSWFPKILNRSNIPEHQ
jgi:hypothetical protein